MGTSFLESQKKWQNDRLYWSPLNINRALAGYIPSQRLRFFFLSVLTAGMLRKVLQVKQWRMTHIVFSPWYFGSCLRFMTVSCFLLSDFVLIVVSNILYRQWCFASFVDSSLSKPAPPNVCLESWYWAVSLSFRVCLCKMKAYDYKSTYSIKDRTV